MPFTVKEYLSLAPSKQATLQRVAAFLGYEQALADLDDEGFEEVFDILGVCEGCCVPNGEAYDDLLLAVRKKFACLLWPIVELLAEQVGRNDFDFTVIIDPSYEDHTRWVIYTGKFVIDSGGGKAWRMQFESLSLIADFIAVNASLAVDRYQECFPHG